MNSSQVTALDPSLQELSKLVEERLALARTLAESLELSSLALVRNDAQAIARGAAHQAELCRQWNCLENELRLRARRLEALTPIAASSSSFEGFNSSRLQAEWDTLSVRLHYLTRVHRSLLRHLERSLAVLTRVVDSCAHTYTPEPGLIRTGIQLRAGE
jgi:hypothetical protein